jgi:hypothetical protein
MFFFYNSPVNEHPFFSFIPFPLSLGFCAKTEEIPIKESNKNGSNDLIFIPVYLRAKVGFGN